MAFGGGTFTAYNKVLPGAYINFISAKSSGIAISSRGTVAILIKLKWGKDAAVFSLTANDFLTNSMALLGYAYDDNEMKPFRELFLNAKKVLVYKLNSGDKATKSGIATAKHKGSRGNSLSVVVAINAEDSNKYDVVTKMGTTVVDTQTVSVVSELKENDYLVWDANLSLEAGTNTLTGGTDVDPVGADITLALAALESESFNILSTTITESVAINTIAAYTKRMRDQQGIKFQTVLFNKAADYEGFINVKNSADLVPWVAGLEAACEINKSCTNRTYDGEYEINTSYTQAQLEDAINAGEFAFHKVGDEFRVLTDINSLTTLSTSKGEEFKSNQTIRILDQIANDIASMFNALFLGQVPNNESGRISLWSAVVSYCKDLQNLQCIENFVADDVKIEAGSDKKSVAITLPIQVVNAMEKLYMTVVIA